MPIVRDLIYKKKDTQIKITSVLPNVPIHIRLFDLLHSFDVIAKIFVLILPSVNQNFEEKMVNEPCF